jgi:hypothetical protein
MCNLNCLPAFATCLALSGILSSVGTPVYAQDTQGQTQYRDVNAEIQASRNRYDALRVEIATSFLENVATHFKAAADIGSSLDAVGKLRSSKRISPEARWFLEQLKPVKPELPRFNAGEVRMFDRLSKAYDLADAIKTDVQSSARGAFTFVSGDTYKLLLQFGMDSLLDDKRLAGMYRAGEVGEAFSKRIGAVGFGGLDFAQGVSLAFQPGQELEATTKLLHGLNKMAWGALGLIAFDGNRKAAEAFSAFGDGVATLGTTMSASTIAKLVYRFDGVAGAMLQRYRAAEDARVLAHKDPQSFEAFVHHDSELIAMVSPAELARANARYGVSSPAARDYPPSTVTRITVDHYRETCTAGICGRTPIPPSIPSIPPVAAAGAPSAPDRARSGVEFDIQPTREDSPSADIAARVLSKRPKPSATTWKVQ